MAEKPAAEKTEQPTPKKLQKAKEEGQVPQSQEMLSVASLLVLVGAVALMAPNLMQWFKVQMKQGCSGNFLIFSDNLSVIRFVNSKIIDVFMVIWPILAALMASAILTGVAISGFNFTTKAVRLQWDKITPSNGLKTLFNSKTVVQLIFSIAKLFLIGLIVWLYLDAKKQSLASLRWAWSEQIVVAIAQIILGLLIRVGIALLILAIADVIYQKWKYNKDLMMTRQEVKQERKDYEGSPEVKRRLRRLQFEMSLKRIAVEVPKADVVLVNPTHVAAALRYDSQTMEAPELLAKGADNLAEKITEIARAYGVPIIRRPELARTIYSSVKEGQPIPPSLYLAVAEVLAMIYRLRQSKK